MHYYQELISTIQEIKPNELLEIKKILLETKNKKNTIFIIGNGGSASTAEHMCNDFIKIANLKAIALTNISIITAYGNDINYDSIFLEQLKKLMKPGDVVIGITGSGNSPNIIKALEYANIKGTAIAFLGFDGGIIKNKIKNIIHIKSDNYGIIEDLHLSLGHYFAQELKE